jgi:hypothetical protein
MNAHRPPPFKNPLPGVPGIESPFFDAIFADADEVTRQLARQLNQYGFAVIEFPDPDFEQLAQALKTDLAPHYSASAQAAFRAGEGADLRLRDAWRFDANVRRIAANPIIIEAVSNLKFSSRYATSAAFGCGTF